ncbi:MAG: ECF-type sigma factor [Pseudomonadales bacterium]
MNADVDVTQLLRAWQAGDQTSRDKLFSLVHKNMHAIARNILRADRQRYVLQATELVNECVLRLFGINNLDWHDRAHFISVASTTMRRILVDEARRQQAAKRDAIEITFVNDKFGEAQRPLEIGELDLALTHLGEVSAELVQVVELKYFGGLTNEEAAAVLGVSESTVKRSWRTARAWLFNELNKQD